MLKRTLFVMGTMIMCIVGIGMVTYSNNEMTDEKLVGRYLEIKHSDPNEEREYIEGDMTYEFKGYDDENPEYLEYIVYENGNIRFTGEVLKSYAENVVNK